MVVLIVEYENMLIFLSFAKVSCQSATFWFWRFFMFVTFIFTLPTVVFYNRDRHFYDRDRHFYDRDLNFTLATRINRAVYRAGPYMRAWFALCLMCVVAFGLNIHT